MKRNNADENDKKNRQHTVSVSLTQMKNAIDKKRPLGHC